MGSEQIQAVIHFIAEESSEIPCIRYHRGNRQVKKPKIEHHDNVEAKRQSSIVNCNFHFFLLLSFWRMPPPTLTPAQLALQAERRALKQAKKEAAQALAKENGTAPVVITDAERSRYLNRSWVGVKGKKVDDRESRKVWLVTWNVSR